VNEDLAFAREEMGFTNQQSFSTEPLPGPPPNYSNDESIELRNLGPRFPPPGPPPAGPQNQPAPDPGDRPFAFYKPQKDPRTKLYIGMLVFLTIVIIILATVLGLTILSHEKKAAVQLPQSTTISTISTTLVSTETLSFTATEVSSTTQVTTQTRTLTSVLPNPTSVPGCWSLLQDLCGNTNEIDPGALYKEYWDQCQEIYGIFYCGVIQQLESQHMFNIPADDSPVCNGMLAFCDKIGMGDPLRLHLRAPATSTSLILQRITPVSKRGFIDMTPGDKVRQLSRIHHSTRVPGPLPTDSPDYQSHSSGY
jgi:hypothetical protein